MQEPQLIKGLTVTFVPIGYLGCSLSIVAENSCPKISGAFARGCVPANIFKSVPQIPAYAFLIKHTL